MFVRTIVSILLAAGVVVIEWLLAAADPPFGVVQSIISIAEKHPPLPGAWCSCCWGTRWWTERYEPKGWRCAACHPARHLRDDQVWINDQPAPLPEPTGPLL